MTTPIRAIRIPDDLWHAAQAQAASQGSSLSQIVRDLLAAWMGR